MLYLYMIYIHAVFIHDIYTCCTHTQYTHRHSTPHIYTHRDIHKCTAYKYIALSVSMLLGDKQRALALLFPVD